ncbi:MAG: delta-aminolevulinic acid dehydratase [Candidatus Melainabacteria bacterium RIFCSPHIGHO2_02_FULL_34_12]|nr:MAG: delta-aminolevulinic acid dehydratase [Candidatus Melainabacteria bacterium RIFCSPHIGHO2_02_FULL_34_12]
MQSINIKSRPRRLRKNEIVRNLVQETILSPAQFIAPVFIHEGKEPEIKINSMPGIFQFSIDRALKHIEELKNNRINSILIFGIPNEKDNEASSAWDENGIIQKANKKIKEHFPDILLVNDTCLCEYMAHGHCGIVLEKDILNDPTLDILQKTAVSQAASGADIIAPSGMMDGMVSAIRSALDQNGFQDTAIISYAVKYASSFYGPFREAAESTPQFGDRKSYQMNPGNKKEAIREALTDEKEGADIIMIKPAMPYLDIILAVKDKVNLPVAAYNVSGEYSMIKAASQNGWLDENKAAYEMLTSIKRAGADIIISYFAKDLLKLLKSFED